MEDEEIYNSKVMGNGLTQFLKSTSDLVIGNWNLVIVNCKLEIANFKLEIGNWKLDIGN